MDAPLISVIVPVYKVEAYLDRCVQSIANQTYRNLEIILVDDGSPDNCPAMCDAWAEKDSRIRVIHKENGGLSDARNAGIAVATGEFIGFVDSDDYIAPNMYQLLQDRMTVDGSDIAACGVEMVFEDSMEPRRLTIEGSCVLDRNSALEAIICESWLKQPVWNKLYKTSLAQNIHFPVGKCHEDVFWSYQAVARAQKVSVVDTPCYYYLQRNGSIMGEGYSLKRLDAIGAKQQRLAFLEREYPQLAELARRDLLFSCLYHGQRALRSLDRADLNIALARLENIVKSNEGGIGSLPTTYKCWRWLAKKNFKLCCTIRNKLGIGL